MSPKRAKTKTKKPSATIQSATGLVGDAPDPTPTPQVSAEDRVRQLMGHLQDDVNAELGEAVATATKPVSVDPIPTVSLAQEPAGFMDPPVSMLPETTTTQAEPILPATEQPHLKTFDMPTIAGGVEVVTGARLRSSARQPQ